MYKFEHQLSKLAQSAEGRKLIAKMSDPAQSAELPQRLTHKGEREFDVQEYDWAINAGLISLDDLNLLNEHGMMAIKDIQNQSVIGAILGYYQARMEIGKKPLRIINVVEPCNINLAKLSDLLNNGVNKRTGTTILRVASLVTMPKDRDEHIKNVENAIRANHEHKPPAWEAKFYLDKKINDDEFRKAMKAFGTDTKYLQFSRSLIEKIYNVDAPIGLTNAKLPNHIDGFIDIMPNEFIDGNKRYQVWYFVTKPVITFAIYDFQYRKITDTVRYDMETDKYTWLFREANITDELKDPSISVWEIWESDPIYETIDNIIQLTIFLVGWYYYTVVGDLYYAEAKDRVEKGQLMKKSVDNQRLAHIERLDIFYGHNIIVDHEIPVRGHYRRISGKDGTMKLTWVKEHERHGYNRRAGALKKIE